MSERYFGVSGPESPALTLHHDLEERQLLLDNEHDSLGMFGIAEPDIYAVQLKGGHSFVGIDESVQPGGAFKYYSSAASVATVPEGTREVVTFTAGNFGKTLGQAALRAGLPARAFTPYDLNPLKHAGMTESGMEVSMAAYDVAGAGEVAKAYIDKTPGAVLLHPFNNPWGMAGLRYMGLDVSTALRKLSADGQIDLDHPTDVMVPRGGGSGVSGVASGLYSGKRDGSLPTNISVYAVRPSRLPGGEMNPRYDGLRVAEPGSNAKVFLEDRRFIRDTRIVDEASVADASRLMTEINPDKSVAYEPSALIALGAVTQWISDNPRADPRNFVAVLTGRNTDPVHRDYFANLPGYKTTDQYQRHQQDAARREAADAVWSQFQLIESTGGHRRVADPRRTGVAMVLGGATIRR